MDHLVCGGTRAELTEEMIAAAMAKADKRVCVGSDRCFALPHLLADARASCTPKGRCKVGWIVSRGGRESWDVWLEVSTGLVKLIRQAKAWGTLVTAGDRGRVMVEDTSDEQEDENNLTYQEFIALPDKELRRRIATPYPDIGRGYYSVEAYRDELNRRVAERQTRWLIWLTVVIAFLTAVLIAIELGWLRAISGH